MTERRRWIVDLALVAVLIGGVHLSRLGTLPLRGEESRWARVAVEMVEGGDWIVPRQQSQPFLSRPPLGSWLIAASATAVGEFSPLAVRLPSALATLLVGMLLYAYLRIVAGSRVGGIAAAIGYATMGHVLQLGQLAESEAVFTLLLAGSLIGWHLLRTVGASPVACWVVGYGLAALAALTKGPQAPAYFVCGVGLYLLARRDLRSLLTRAHLAGIVAFAAVLLAWQVPFAMRVGLPAVREIWSGDTLLRFESATFASWLSHLATYPIEVLACTAPWSVFLVTYLYRDFRRNLGRSRDAAIFSACGIVPALLSCWIVPNSRGRYFMPLYPLLAVLVGLAIDAALSAESVAAVRAHWRRFARFAALAAVGAALAMVALRSVASPEVRNYHEPAAVLVAYGLAAGMAAALLWRSSRPNSPAQGVAGLVAAAAFLGITGTGIGINVNARASEDTGGAVAEIRRKLPDDARLVSFGVVHHLFAYHFDRPIEFRRWEQGTHDDPTVEYFCFDVMAGAERPLRFPFAWEPIGRVSNERYRRDEPRFVTVVARRLPDGAAVASDEGGPPRR